MDVVPANRSAFARAPHLRQDDVCTTPVAGRLGALREEHGMSARMIKMERIVDAPPERVYRMWSDPDTI